MDNNSKPYHIPVLLNEVIHYLNLKPGGTYLDVTFGGGGHTRAILQAEPTCQVIACDWDLVALEKNGDPLKEEFGDRLTLIWGNFSQIDKHLKKIGVYEVDGILADFGTSFYQLTQRAGFSFHTDTPLDMRMSPSHQKITASEVINKASEQTLRDIFERFGEEDRAKAVARAITEARKKKPIYTTKELTQVIEKVLGKPFGRKTHPATRVFQALRIYINNELDNIHSFLISGMRVLKPGGRMVCISFHSLEDRAVKQYFKDQEAFSNEIITPRVVIPTDEEIAQNPASRSAKLRVLRKGPGQD